MNVIAPECYNITEMLIPNDEVNILNTFRVMIILRLLLLLKI